MNFWDWANLHPVALVIIVIVIGITIIGVAERLRKK